MSHLKEIKRVVTVIKEAIPAFSAAGSLVFYSQLASAASEKQQIDPNTNCPFGENPHYVLGFAQLEQVVGADMGDPLECEHGNPDKLDTLQKTSKGLNYWRQTINQTIFTDGYRHWSNKNGVFLYWEGQDIEPPVNATPIFSPPESANQGTILKKEFTKNNQNFSVMIDTRLNPAIPINFNPDSVNMFEETIAKDGQNLGYKNLSVKTLTSVDQLPDEVDRLSVGGISVRKDINNPSFGLDNATAVGNIASISLEGTLYYFIIPNNTLINGDSRILQDATTIFNYFLTSALLHNGNWNANNALFQQPEHLQLAASNPIVLSSPNLALTP